MSKIIDYILNMLPYMLVSFPLIFLIRLIIVSVKGLGKRTTLWHEIGIQIFFLFLVGLASQTIIPALEIRAHGIGIILSAPVGGVNLIPGKVFYDIWYEGTVHGYWMYFIINFLGNICMFIPIGFGLNLLWREQTLLKTALIGLGISLFIEICQFPQNRHSDIDDLWLNTLGAIIGYLIYKLLNNVMQKFFDKFKTRRNI